MKKLRLSLFVLAALFLGIGAQGRVLEAGRDDIATGAVILDTGAELRLNTSPCGGSGDIVVFYAPYTKSRVGALRCGSTVIERYQVAKQ
jgi:hypothetical protein